MCVQRCTQQWRQQKLSMWIFDDNIKYEYISRWTILSRNTISVRFFDQNDDIFTKYYSIMKAPYIEKCKIIAQNIKTTTCVNQATPFFNETSPASSNRSNRKVFKRQTRFFEYSLTWSRGDAKARWGCSINVFLHSIDYDPLHMSTCFEWFLMIAWQQHTTYKYSPLLISLMIKSISKRLRIFEILVI